jgi:methyl-accepting chemotaxis protein
MRRGAVTTSRAVTEQAVASEQIVKASGSMARTIESISRAINDQSSATEQISRATESMRQQAEQAAKALKEQSRAMRDMSTAAANTTKQIKLITHANREHSQVSDTLLGQLTEVRRVTDRNIRGVKDTQTSTADLLRHAGALRDLIESSGVRRAASNGGPGTNGH